MIEAKTMSKPFPIQVFVSYEWTKPEKDEKHLLPNSDPKWQSLRKILEDVANEVKELAKRRSNSVQLDIRVNRLRGRHGSLLIHTLRERIQRADIFVADIAGSTLDTCNSNVMIELGMTLAYGKLESNGIYVLSPVNGKKPSDLNGILYTEYDLAKDNDSMKLVDNNGFRAALRTSIIDIARDRGMFGPPNEATVELDDEENANKEIAKATSPRQRTPTKSI